VYADCTIGSRVIIHAGTVIGADGFGFVPDEEGKQVKIPQLGRVIIEDDCEIGANCTIDRGGFSDTVVQRGVKLDNLIQVGHNTMLGENTVVAALTGFSGGTSVGRNCVIAGQVGTNQHVQIGDRALVTGQTGVTKDIPAGAMVGGMSQDLKSWRRSQVIFANLPELKDRLRKVEKTVEQLTLDKESQAERQK
jgi:UDP-3-O-[3-hydroxymyristoyl] glucosamine N-acyltransferase